MGHKRFACPHIWERTQEFAADTPRPGRGAAIRLDRGCQVGETASHEVDSETHSETAKADLSPADQTTGSVTPAVVTEASRGAVGEAGQDESRSEPARVAAGEGAASSEHPYFNGEHGNQRGPGHEYDSDSQSAVSDIQPDQTSK